MGKSKKNQQVGSHSAKASSSAAASLLTATGNNPFLLFASGAVDSHGGGSFALLAESLPPELRTTFRLLKKKDSSSKLRGLEELQKLFHTAGSAASSSSSSSVDLFAGADAANLVDAFCRAYSREAVLAVDWRVRQALQRTLGALLDQPMLKKLLGPRFKLIAGPWFCAMFDPDSREASAAATALFDGAFAPGDVKRAKAISFALPSLVREFHDTFARTTKQTLDQRFPGSTVEETADRFSRLLAATASASLFLLQEISGDSDKKQQQQQHDQEMEWAEYILTDRLFRLLTRGPWAVRLAVFRLLAHTSKTHGQLVRPHLQQLAEPVLCAVGREKDGRVYVAVWEAVLTMTAVFGSDAWSLVQRPDQQFFPRLFSFLRDGALDTGLTSYRCLIPLLRGLPTYVVDTDHDRQFQHNILTSLWAGLQANDRLAGLDLLLETFSALLCMWLKPSSAADLDVGPFIFQFPQFYLDKQELLPPLRQRSWLHWLAAPFQRCLDRPAVIAQAVDFFLDRLSPPGSEEKEIDSCVTVEKLILIMGAIATESADQADAESRPSRWASALIQPVVAGARTNVPFVCGLATHLNSFDMLFLSIDEQNGTHNDQKLPTSHPQFIWTLEQSIERLFSSSGAENRWIQKFFTMALDHMAASPSNNQTELQRIWDKSIEHYISKKDHLCDLLKFVESCPRSSSLLNDLCAKMVSDIESVCGDAQKAVLVALDKGLISDQTIESCLQVVGSLHDQSHFDDHQQGELIASSVSSKLILSLCRACPAGVACPDSLIDQLCRWHVAHPDQSILYEAVSSGPQDPATFDRVLQTVLAAKQTATNAGADLFLFFRPLLLLAEQSDNRLDQLLRAFSLNQADDVRRANVNISTSVPSACTRPFVCPAVGRGRRRPVALVQEFVALVYELCARAGSVADEDTAVRLASALSRRPWILTEFAFADWWTSNEQQTSGVLLDPVVDCLVDLMPAAWFREALVDCLTELENGARVQLIIHFHGCLKRRHDDSPVYHTVMDTICEHLRSTSAFLASAPASSTEACADNERIVEHVLIGLGDDLCQWSDQFCQFVLDHGSIRTTAASLVAVTAVLRGSRNQTLKLAAVDIAVRATSDAAAASAILTSTTRSLVQPLAELYISACVMGLVQSDASLQLLTFACDAAVSELDRLATDFTMMDGKVTRSAPVMQAHWLERVIRSARVLLVASVPAVKASTWSTVGARAVGSLFTLLQELDRGAAFAPSDRRNSNKETEQLLDLHVFEALVLVAGSTVASCVDRLPLGLGRLEEQHEATLVDWLLHGHLPETRASAHSALTLTVCASMPSTRQQQEDEDAGDASNGKRDDVKSLVPEWLRIALTRSCTSNQLRSLMEAADQQHYENDNSESCPLFSVEPAGILCVSADAFGQLLAFDLFLSILERANTDGRAAACQWLRQSPVGRAFFSFLFRCLNRGVGRQSQPASPPAGAAAKRLRPIDLCGRSRASGQPTAVDPVVGCGLAARCFVRASSLLPLLLRQWYLGSDCSDRVTSQRVLAYVEKVVSPVLVDAELSAVSAWAQSDDAIDCMDTFQVRAVRASSEIQASFEAEDVMIRIVVVLPRQYPLANVDVKAVNAQGVTEKRKRKWLISIQTCLLTSDTTLLDAVLKWKQSLDATFSDKDPCAVCLSLLTPSGHLPGILCTTCSTPFHEFCLTTWFDSSGKKECPLCKSPM